MAGTLPGLETEDRYPATDIPGLGAGGPARKRRSPQPPRLQPLWTTVAVSVTDLFYWVVFVVFFF